LLKNITEPHLTVSTGRHTAQPELAAHFH